MRFTLRTPEGWLLLWVITAQLNPDLMAFQFAQNDVRTHGMEKLNVEILQFAERLQTLNDARTAFAQAPPHGLKSSGPTTLNFHKITLNRLLNPANRPKPDGLRLYFGLRSNGKLQFVVCGATLQFEGTLFVGTHDLTELVLRSSDGRNWKTVTQEQAAVSLRRFRNQLNNSDFQAKSDQPGPGHGTGTTPSRRPAKGYFLGRTMLYKLTSMNRIQLILFTQTIRAQEPALETIGLSITYAPIENTLDETGQIHPSGPCYFYTHIAAPPNPGAHHSPTCTRPCPNACGELGRET